MQTELHIPSNLKFLPIVEDWILNSLSLELGDLPNWPEWEGKLRLVVVEAYSNVVRHAHRDRPDIPVVLKLTVSAGVLCIEVWDQGQGFDLSTYLPPVPATQQEGGYGWLILNRLMDKVEYQIKAQGQQNCLKLQADLSTDDYGQISPQPISL